MRSSLSLTLAAQRIGRSAAAAVYHGVSTGGRRAVKHRSAAAGHGRSCSNQSAAGSCSGLLGGGRPEVGEMLFAIAGQGEARCRSAQNEARFEKADGVGE